MSNIFQPLTRDNGGILPLNIGIGVLVDPVKNQHLNLDATGAVYAILDGAINHHGAGLPFDIDGRLVVSSGALSYWDQSIPFTATGAVCLGGGIGHIDQSLSYDAEGKLSQTAVILGAFSSAFSSAFDAVVA
jgi:hypothetical protein